MSQKHNIQPLFDYVLIKPLEAETKTPSGIVIPDTAKEKPQMGEIMAVGPGSTNDQGKKVPIEVKVGQKVLYKKWGGNEVKVGPEEWLLLEQKEIMAVVK
ncbi:co-chaperone GroES [Candidatus Roizmanbacteria bacterium RIFCSPLOWO2_02_FULL_37_19]|uniref:Co-chaperonin GroES n=1 Tax=Candidatus Roizmanbacteria bacterium RIFCSPHIGHO2_02_FULL_37_24 TaxID=1802037 RepID=A0A1F7GWZ9_9BACT|nr:MAG: co-chaperone GroES [Candidatus Roizmanbacteria bacterium RIFCSPHIGHO2_01_FULL_38_41]OGK23617.1 MAG: co-chaperone GroES [Candidatus Roizmanbacteria bacterium RIFCSPHIGHO2_02_FULL_37_24]OGK32940.1 MAG: co-chaperone GroES [Candidatus Roizmanbacteria bacterium RIFCSPHIGHO2_12_FULL_37_23]OGK44007.1 MAG: co-chaperone GroES [Candidatus Roizmanbacteria bacterium RIFCSPLOWO2_01_FULL_37_57]OGK54654.1 MAG: co-chaperone GroES [Candidatus Roizmanbacteria bacterium RIFCSPLOWO2_02_FULL_37_19]OGK60454